MMTASATDTLDCGHVATPREYVTGYATTADGRRVCYACADDMQRADLLTQSRAFGYLSGDRVTTWTGGTLMTVTRAVNRTMRTPTATCRRIFVRATDVHGQKWYGSGPADSGTYVLLRRCK